MTDLSYLDALLAPFADLPMGAWRAFGVDAIAADPRFRGRDARAIWRAWATTPRGAR